MPKTVEPFNADSRARERESKPITIGDREFYPRRRTPKVMRAFRAIVRQDQELARKLDDLADGDLEEREKIEDEREDLMYEMVAAFVKPKDGESDEVDVEFLGDHLDIEDVSDLLDQLTPGAGAGPYPGGYTPADIELMANLSRYGHVQPSEGDALDEDVQVALAKKVEALRRSDEEGLVELVVGAVKAIGTIVARSR